MQVLKYRRATEHVVPVAIVTTKNSSVLYGIQEFHMKFGWGKVEED
jgi:hypothetical protein